MKSSPIIRGRVTNSVVVLCIVLLSINAAAVEISREEIVQKLTPKISISLTGRDVTDPEKQQIRDGLKLDRWARELLPEKFEVQTENHKELILNSYNHIISFNHPEHIELGIKLTLMNVGLRCYASKLSPVLTEQDDNRIKEVVSSISDGVRTSMYQSLGSVIPNGDIDTAVDKQVTKVLLRKKDEPWTYVMKKPIDTDEVERLIGVFDKRLSLTKDRAVKRMERVQGIDGLDGEKKSIMLSQEKMHILFEVMHPLVSAVYKATSIEHEEMDSQEYFPRYPDILQRFHTLDTELSKQAWTATRMLQQTRSDEDLFTPQFGEDLFRPQLIDEKVVEQPNNAVSDEHQPVFTKSTREPCDANSDSTKSDRDARSPKVIPTVVVVVSVGLIFVLAFLVFGKKIAP